MEVEVSVSGSGKQFGKRCSSSAPALPKEEDLIGPIQPGVPYMLCSVADDDDDDRNIIEVNGQKKRRGYGGGSNKSLLKLWDVYNKTSKFVSYSLEDEDEDADADADADADVVWYACGRKGGWMVAVYPSKGFKIKLVNIFNPEKAKAKAIIDLPPLPPRRFFLRHKFPPCGFYKRNHLYFDEGLLRELGDQESFSFAKFILHGDPSSGDFALVALFTRHVVSRTVQAAVLLPSVRSPPSQWRWVAILNRRPFEDVVLHGDTLWAIDRFQELYSFPLKSLLPPPPGIRHPSMYDRLYDMLVLVDWDDFYMCNEKLDVVFASNKYVSPGIYHFSMNERDYDMFYLVDQDDDDDPKKKLFVVRNGYRKLQKEREPARPPSMSALFSVYEFSLTDNSVREVPDLGNRALFVGDNASFLVKLIDGANNPAGLTRNCIYFSDKFCSRNYFEMTYGLEWVLRLDVGVFDLNTSQLIDLPVPAAAETHHRAQYGLPLPVPQWIFS